MKFRVGDFFKEPLPAADVLVMGMILHDWNLDVMLPSARVILQYSRFAREKYSKILAIPKTRDADFSRNRSVSSLPVCPCAREAKR